MFRSMVWTMRRRSDESDCQSCFRRWTQLSRLSLETDTRREDWRIFSPVLLQTVMSTIAVTRLSSEVSSSLKTRATTDISTGAEFCRAPRPARDAKHISPDKLLRFRAAIVFCRTRSGANCFTPCNRDSITRKGRRGGPIEKSC